MRLIFEIIFSFFFSSFCKFSWMEISFRFALRASSRSIGNAWKLFHLMFIQVLFANSFSMVPLRTEREKCVAWQRYIEIRLWRYPIIVSNDIPFLLIVFGNLCSVAIVSKRLKIEANNDCASSVCKCSFIRWHICDSKEKRKEKKKKIHKFSLSCCDTFCSRVECASLQHSIFCSIVCEFLFILLVCCLHCRCTFHALNTRVASEWARIRRNERENSVNSFRWSHLWCAKSTEKSSTRLRRQRK